MAQLKCPSSQYDNYNSGTSFYGCMVSMLSADLGLFYVIDTNSLDSFSTIERFEPKDKLDRPPYPEENFLYRNDGGSYRAIGLNSNSADQTAIRAFLYDIGQTIYKPFNSESFFKLPSNFDYPSMALFCCIETLSFNTEMEQSAFLRRNFFKTVKFTVKRVTSIINPFGFNELCLVVEIETELGSSEDKGKISEQLEDEVTEQSDNQVIETSVDTLLEITFAEDSVTASEIPAPEPLEPDSIIMVFITESSRLDQIYVQWLKVEDATTELMTPALTLQRWMNNKSVISQYVKFKIPPVIDEMVVVIGRSKVYRRGMVVKINRNPVSFLIFFVDYGYLMDVNLENIFMFPIECMNIPFQAAQLAIPNATSMKAIKTFQQKQKTSRAMAKVVSSNFDTSVLKLTADVFDLAGNNLLSNKKYSSV